MLHRNKNRSASGQSGMRNASDTNSEVTMSMHEEFTAPVARYGEISPETVQFHIARARALRSQAFSAHMARIGRFVSKLFTRHADKSESVHSSDGLAAN